MTRTLLSTVVVIVACLVAPATSLAAPLVRTTSGQMVVVDRETLVVTWRLDDRASLVALQLANEAARVQGLNVVAVNLDGANSRSRIAPYLRCQGLRFEGSVAAADEPWLADLTDSQPGVALMGDEGQAEARVMAGGGGTTSMASLVVFLGLLDDGTAVASSAGRR
jgi:hypothetical protein